MKTIPLPDGRAFTVDDEDYEFATRWKWRANGNPYLRRSVSIPPWNLRRNKHVYLHRLLMDAPEGCVVDHIDGNPLNNQRSNLRICSLFQNNANRRNTPSQFRGTYEKRGRIFAEICSHGFCYRAGPFPTREAAHAAYLRAASCLHGGFNPLARRAAVSDEAMFGWKMAAYRGGRKYLQRPSLLTRAS